MRLCARCSQPLATAGSPRNRRWSAARYAAIRAAELLSPRSRYRRYARSRASNVSPSSFSMCPTQPIPSSASGVSPSAKDSSKAVLAPSQSPFLRAAQPTSSDVAWIGSSIHLAPSMNQARRIWQAALDSSASGAQVELIFKYSSDNLRDVASGAAKVALFDAFASVAQALGSGRRAEIVDVLAQGERSVDEIANEISQSVANTSQHLHVLARAGLVRSRREGTRVFYRLASERVGDLWAAVRDVAVRHVAEVNQSGGRVPG